MDASLARTIRTTLSNLDRDLAISLRPLAGLAAARSGDICVALITDAARADPDLLSNIDDAMGRGTLLAVRVGHSPLPPRMLSSSLRVAEAAEVPAAIAKRLADWLDRPTLRGIAGGNSSQPSASVQPPPPPPSRPAPPPQSTPRPQPSPKPGSAPVPAASAVRMRRSHIWLRQSGLVAILLLLMVPVAFPPLKYSPPSVVDAWWAAILLCGVGPAMGFAACYLSWSLIDPTTAARSGRGMAVAALLATAIAGAATASLAAILAFILPDQAVTLTQLALILTVVLFPAALLAAGITALLDRRRITISATTPAFVALALAAAVLPFALRPLLRTAAENQLIGDVRDQLGRVGYRVSSIPDWKERDATAVRRDGAGALTIPLDDRWKALTDRIRAFQKDHRLPPDGLVATALLDRLKALPDKLVWRMRPDGKGDAASLTDAFDRMSEKARIELAPGTYACPNTDGITAAITMVGSDRAPSVINCRAQPSDSMTSNLHFPGGSRVRSITFLGKGRSGADLQLDAGGDADILLEDVTLKGMWLRSSATSAKAVRLTAPTVYVDGGSLVLEDSLLTGGLDPQAIVDVAGGRVVVERSRFPQLGNASALRVGNFNFLVDEKFGESRFSDNDVHGGRNPRLPAIFMRSGSAVVTGNRFSDVAGPCILVEGTAAGRYERNRLDRCGHAGAPPIAIAKGSKATVGSNEILPAARRGVGSGRTGVTGR